MAMATASHEFPVTFSLERSYFSTTLGAIWLRSVVVKV
jgi:hypothetical protein